MAVAYQESPSQPPFDPPEGRTTRPPRGDCRRCGGTGEREDDGQLSACACTSLPGFITGKKLSKRELATKEDLDADGFTPPPLGTRADCQAGAPGYVRPCPFAARCRHGLYIEAGEDARGRHLIRLMHPGTELAATRYSCSLDVADTWHEGLTLEEIGSLLGMTRERVRQTEEEAIRKFVEGMGLESLEAAMDALAALRESNEAANLSWSTGNSRTGRKPCAP